MILRQEILKVLKERSGEWVSGEVLSKDLNVSRTTIWKHVKALRDDGYQFESSPRKGYRIMAPADILSAEEVQSGLVTKVFGQKNYVYYRQIDSTNKHARTLAEEGYPEGTMVIAEEQTAGKGRRGREWYSPFNRGIYMSIILRPNLPLRQIPRLSLLTAVALAEVLEETGLRPGIKWPNDILVNGKKIAGILAEIITDMDGVEFIVLGIGININNSSDDFPDDLRTPPTSIMSELGMPGSRVELLQKLLLSLEQHYELLQTDHFTFILEKARRLSTVLGKKVQFDDSGVNIAGMALDLDENGFLLVQDEKGKVHTVISGEINSL